MSADSVTLKQWVEAIGGTDDALRTRAAGYFEALDADADDRVSLAELETASSATGALHRAFIDTNWLFSATFADLRDGTLEMLRNPVLVPVGADGLTRATWDATFGASLGAFFEQLDEDGDGTVTRDDVIALGESGTEANLQLLLGAQAFAALGLLPEPPVAADRIAPANTQLTNAEIADLGFVPAHDHGRLSMLWLQNNGYFIDRANIDKMKAFKDHGGNVLYDTDDEYKAVVDAFASLIEEYALPGLTDGPDGPIDRRTDFIGFVRQVYRVNYTGTALTWDQRSAIGQLTWPLVGEVWRMQDRAAKGLSRRALEFTAEFAFGAAEAVAGVAEAIWNIRELPGAIHKLLTDENAQEALWQQLKKSVDAALEGDPRALGKLTVEVPMAITGAGAVVKTGKVALNVTVATGKALVDSGLKGKKLVAALLRADREAAQAAELSKLDPSKWRATIEERVAQATKLPDEASAVSPPSKPSAPGEGPHKPGDTAPGPASPLPEIPTPGSPLARYDELVSSGKVTGTAKDIEHVRKRLASKNNADRIGAEAELTEIERQIANGQTPEIRGGKPGTDSPTSEVKARTEPFTSKKNAQTHFNTTIKKANEQFARHGSEGEVVINLGAETHVLGQPITAEVAREMVASALEKGGRGTNITNVLVIDGKGTTIYCGLGK